MQPHQPAISFLTPAFSKPQLLRRALDSLLQQTCGDWEMVLSPDDGADYSDVARIDPRIRLVDPQGAMQTGPGPARNRALAHASGAFVACLDDDDAVADNFVEECLGALQTACAVLVPSVYVTVDQQPVRAAGTGVQALDIAGFAELYATMHVICRRDLAQPWGAFFAEDVVHTCAAIERNGGTIAVVGRTEYRITVHENSLCATTQDIDAQYGRLIQWIEQQVLMAECSESGRQQTRHLLIKRMQLQRLFESRSDPGMGYQSFVHQYLLSQAGAPAAQARA